MTGIHNKVEKPKGPRAEIKLVYRLEPKSRGATADPAAKEDRGQSETILPQKTEFRPFSRCQGKSHRSDASVQGRREQQSPRAAGKRFPQPGS